MNAPAPDEALAAAGCVSVAAGGPPAARRPRRTRIGWWGVAVLGAALAAIVGFQELHRFALRLELDLARDQARDLAALRVENAVWREKQPPADELLRLRADRAALERLRAELELIKASASGARARPNVVPKFVPSPVRSVLEMKNAGTATPMAAGETFVWALQQGEIEQAAGLIRFLPDARARMETILASLPPSYRSQYATPEQFLAFVLAGSGSVSALQVVGESSQGDRAVLRLEVQLANGGRQEDWIQFQREPEGWRRLITAKTVDSVASYLGVRPPPARR